MNRLLNRLQMPLFESRSRFIRLLPLVVLCLSLSVTLYAWRTISATNRDKAFYIYTDKTREIADRIIKRMHDHDQVLLGGVGLFTVKPEVTRGDWRSYVAALQLNQYHPGILGIGYAAWLTPAEKDANLKAIRAEGFPEYSIRPAGARPAYTSIIYLEPFSWRNQRAFGYDMYSEPLRRAAMEQARDTGGATIAAPVFLVQETEKGKQRGLLMYRPLYRRGMALDSTVARRAALKGFVYSPIRMNDFVYCTLGKLPEDIAFEIYAGTAATPAAKIFSSIEGEHRTLPEANRSSFTSSLTIEGFGCPWLFTFRSLPAFGAILNEGKATVNLIGGGVFISVLLSVITFMILTNRNHALALAQEMTDELRKNERDLQESNERFSTIFHSSPVAIGLSRLDNNEIIDVNETFLHLTGYERPEVIGHTALDLGLWPHPEERETLLNELCNQGRVPQVEMTFRRKSMEICHILMSVELLSLSGQQYLLGMLTDITPRKNAEMLLASLNEELEYLVAERTEALSQVNGQLLLEIEDRKKIEQDILDQQKLLQNMSLELVMAEERERDRIAGELHDQIGQRLILVKMKLDALDSRLAVEKPEEEVTEIVTLVEQTIQDTRSLTFQIRPPLLASAGLEATVQWLGEELSEHYGLQMALTADSAAKSLPYQIRSTVFQAIRELLLNVARHAGTAQVRVLMSREGPFLVITINDDGRGFDIVEARARNARSGGFGLFNTQQKIEYLGGSLTIDSSPGTGTRAIIRVPLAETPDEWRDAC